MPGCEAMVPRACQYLLRCGVVAGYFLATAVVVCGQVPSPAEAVRFERVEGLSHNSVLSILQDRRGFLWIGTLDGLNRFDGVDFVVYRHIPGDTSSLSGNTVRFLLEDRDGRLWVGTDDGLNSLDRASGRFRRHALPGEGSKKILAIAEDEGGRLWVTTFAGALYRSDPSKQRFFVYRPDGVDGDALVGIVPQDGRTRLWLVALRKDSVVTLHLYEGDGHELRSYRLPVRVGPPSRPVPPLHVDASGMLWVAAPPPAEAQSSSPFAYVSDLPPQAVPQDILRSRTGTVWIGGAKAAYRFEPDSQQLTRIVLDTTDTAWLSNNVQCLYEDRAGAVWAGTLSGLYHFDPHRKPFAFWGPGSGLPPHGSRHAVVSLSEDSTGGLWLGTIGSGLLYLNQNRELLAHYRHRAGDPNGLPGNNVWSIHATEDGLWLATEPVCFFEPETGRCTRYNIRSFVVAEDSTGHIWFARADTLFRLDPRTGTLERRITSLSEVQVFHVSRREPSVLWIGTEAGQLGRLQLQTFQLDVYPAHEERTVAFPGGIWAIHEDKRGDLWLGTSHGLFRFDPDERVFQSFFDPAALPGSIVYSILEDDQGRFWMGTNQGIVRFDPRTARFRHYDTSDGIGNLEFNRRAALRRSDGRFFFGGLRGVTTFDPDAIRDNPFVPPVAVKRITVANRERSRIIYPSAGSPIPLDYTDYSIAFEFAALNFTSAQKNLYAYRLEGFDDDWIQAGTHRRAQYTNLPPGRYVFRVKGSNNDGVWNEQGAAVELVVSPPFWQTWWFRALAGVFLVGILTAVYRARVGHLLEMERLRLRIASDLHDDVGSKLGSVALMSEMLGGRDTLGDKERSELARIGTIVRQTAETLRDIVWFVDPEHDHPEALLWKMKNEASSMLNGLDYRFDHDAVEQLAVLHAMDVKQRRNLYLIYKEALHNVVRHAEARSVHIALRAASSRLEFLVEDDGKGFEQTAGNSKGYGLTSMRRRAQQMGATLEVASRPGKGTRLHLVLDITRMRNSIA